MTAFTLNNKFTIGAPYLHGEETYRNFKPKRWKRHGKVRKCYSDLTGKNSYILICYLSTLIAKECRENMIVT